MPTVHIARVGHGLGKRRECVGCMVMVWLAIVVPMGVVVVV